MLYLLGTDEAGYGPNLGPLVVAATLWRVHGPEEGGCVDLYQRLANTVSSDPKQPDRLAIADSKQLYSAGDLRHLERGVLAALQCVGRSAATWQAIWQTLSPSHACELPWHRTFECELPTCISVDELTSGGNLLQQGLAGAQVELVDVRATVVHPADFNERCDRLMSKGAVLSTATLALVRDLIQGRTDGPMQIVCDKHGGRNRYAPLVWEQLAADEAIDCLGFPVQTVLESRDESTYRWQCGELCREIRFVTKGERFMPAALASMIAKYLRELSMMAFNAFWAERVPNLRPTAGYPGDALRFWNDIESVVRFARFSERELWRVK